MSRHAKYELALQVESQKLADIIFGYLVRLAMEGDRSLGRPEAEQVVRDNLGYFAGFYRDEVRSRAERLYGAVHPIHGPLCPDNVVPIRPLARKSK